MTNKPLHFVITGSFLFGNLGSAAMVVVVVEQLKKLYPDCQITLGSKYPMQDNRSKPAYFDDPDQLEIQATPQVKATFLALPMALIYSCFRKCGIKLSFIRKNRIISLFEQADYVIDIGGITFSEERGMSGLLINATWVWLPALLSTPVIKLSQAFGPIKKSWFASVSKWTLKRVAKIISRGRLSSIELDELKLPYEECSDIAFLLSPKETEFVTKYSKNGQKTIGMTPSSVMYKKMGPESFTAHFCHLIKNILKKEPGCKVQLIAHSYKEGKSLNNNDYPVCQEIYDTLPEEYQKKVTLVYGTYTTGEMKYILSQLDMLIACRFHSMVGALGTGVPVVVLGWSHKYREIMEIFELDMIVNYRNFSFQDLWGKVEHTMANITKYQKQVKENLSSCKASSLRNFTLLKDFIENEKNKNC